MTSRPPYEELEQRVEELEESERELVFRNKQLESLVNNSGFAIVSLDESMRIVECNESFEELFLYEKSEIQRKTLDELIVADDQLEKASAYTKTTLTGKNIRGLGQRRRKDGALIDVKFRGIPITVDGEVTGAYGIYEDITALTQAEEALRESEEKYRLLVENQTDLLVKIDREGRFQFVSPSYCRMFGKTEEELLGRTFMPIVHPDDREPTAKEMEKLYYPPHTAYIEQRAMTKDGWKWLAWLDTAVSDEEGNVTGIIGLGRDIDERVRAEDQIARFGRIFEDSLNEIYLFNADTLKFSHVNSGARHNLGYTMEELQEMTPLDLKPEFTPNSFTELVAPLRKSEKEKIIFETVHKRKDGSLYDVEVHLQLLKQEHEALFAAIILDVTERRRAEEEKKKLEAGLQQAQKMEAIGTLAGGIAHDFNNILSAIMGYSELVKMSVSEDSKVITHLNGVLKAARRAKALVQQILTVSRRHKQKRQPIQLRYVVKDALSLLRATLPTTVEIREDLAKDTGIVDADPTQMHQVIMNLGTNAGQAMEKEGGLLTISIENVELDDLEAAPHLDLDSGSYLRLSVSDTGHGMAPEIIEQVFDPYFTTKQIGEGTGLGLSVAHGIVKSHGGTIEVYSQSGEGSTFRVYLPVTEKLEEPKEETEEHIPTGNERVLFIDDELSIAAIGKEMLLHLGYNVVSKTNSIEALDLFRAKPDRFDLIITDMTMPKMTGDKLARELIKIRPDIPVILCTGFSKQISNEKAREMGIQALIMKPISIRDMAQTLRKVLSEK